MITKKRRLIAVVLVKNGNVVQSKNFVEHKRVGSPFTIIDRLSRWNADEVIYLNIRPEISHQNRKDLNSENMNNFLEIVGQVSKRAFMPFVVGGGIRTFEDVQKIFDLGADKVSINTCLSKDTFFIEKSSKLYGSQSIVASVDVKIMEDGKYFIFVNGGKEKINIDLKDYIKLIEDIGAGEILINSINRDGSQSGYDIKLINEISSYTKLPIIGLGGAGSWDDISAVFENTKIDAVAAANIFHFTENSYFEAIKYLNEKKCNLRPPILSDITKVKL